MKMYVYCISMLGQAFIGELVKEDAPEGREIYKNPETLSGIDKYAKVLDIEFEDESYYKWGHDCFTLPDARKKYGSEVDQMLTKLGIVLH